MCYLILRLSLLWNVTKFTILKYITFIFNRAYSAVSKWSWKASSWKSCNCILDYSSLCNHPEVWRLFLGKRTFNNWKLSTHVNKTTNVSSYIRVRCKIIILNTITLCIHEPRITLSEPYKKWIHTSVLICEILDAFSMLNRWICATDAVPDLSGTSLCKIFE